ncbi:MAG: type II toxin-antitoxin system RelE/ParE family toxin [Nitrosomonadales bacterium]|nr:type II toxin-antitoxin system RelE/ParE family toxin [Nitrosomonadales bacterium]
MRFEFHPDALDEYEDAARYYTGCQVGLELRFIAAVEHVIQQIIEAPERWPVLEDDIRRCLARVFPYAVLYSHETDYVLIIAVMHSHR